MAGIMVRFVHYVNFFFWKKKILASCINYVDCKVKLITLVSFIIQILSNLLNIVSKRKIGFCFMSIYTKAGENHFFISELMFFFPIKLVKFISFYLYFLIFFGCLLYIIVILLNFMLLVYVSFICNFMLEMFMLVYFWFN